MRIVQILYLPDFLSSGYGHCHISGSLNFIKIIFRIFLVRPFSSMIREHMQLDKDKKNFVLSALLNNLFISGNMTFKEAVMRFNANVSYSGLLHAVTQDVGYTFVC